MDAFTILITAILDHLAEITALVTAIGAVITYFKQANRKQLLVALKQTTDIAVSSVQQQMPDATPEQKKKAAGDMVEQMMTTQKISIDRETIDFALESAVWIMKNAPQLPAAAGNVIQAQK